MINKIKKMGTTGDTYRIDKIHPVNEETGEQWADITMTETGIKARYKIEDILKDSDA